MFFLRYFLSATLIEEAQEELNNNMDHIKEYFAFYQILLENWNFAKDL